METTVIITKKGAVVDADSWMAARMRLLEQERALTRMSDRVNEQRRKMPLLPITNPYQFDGPMGKVGLAELFGSCNRLIINHFMFSPDWEDGCRGCSFGADANAGMLAHLAHHGYAFAAVSRAPLEKLETFKKRMGWHFNWVSSYSSDFNFDFRVSFTPEQLDKGEAIYNYKPLTFRIDEMPGMSLFYKDEEGKIFLAWSGYGRESDQLIPSLCVEVYEQRADGPAYDLAPWVKLRDRYEGESGAPAEKKTCCP